MIDILLAIFRWVFVGSIQTYFITFVFMLGIGFGGAVAYTALQNLKLRFKKH